MVEPISDQPVTARPAPPQTSWWNRTNEIAKTGTNYTRGKIAFRHFVSYCVASCGNCFVLGLVLVLVLVFVRVRSIVKARYRSWKNLPDSRSGQGRGWGYRSRGSPMRAVVFAWLCMDSWEVQQKADTALQYVAVRA